MHEGAEATRTSRDLVEAARPVASFEVGVMPCLRRADPRTHQTTGAPNGTDAPESQTTGAPCEGVPAHYPLVGGDATDFAGRCPNCRLKIKAAFSQHEAPAAGPRTLDTAARISSSVYVRW